MNGASVPVPETVATRASNTGYAWFTASPGTYAFVRGRYRRVRAWTVNRDLLARPVFGDDDDESEDAYA